MTKTVRDSRQLYRLCLVDGQLDRDRALRIAHRLASSPRRGARAILAEFARFVRLDRDRHAATVSSAQPLPPDLETSVRDGLARRYGPGLNMSFAQDPGLIAGLRIRVGSDVYDGSVRARLDRLQARV